MPDLTANAIRGPPTAVVAHNITVEWTVENIGAADAPAGSWNDKLYLSADGTLNGATLLATVRYDGGLAAGAHVDRSAEVAVPAVPDGDYFIVVVTDADAEVFERDGEANNLGVSAQTLAVLHPDLVAEGVGILRVPLSGDVPPGHGVDLVSLCAGS